MIPRRYIQQWRNQVSWITDAQVEQDLVIGRAVIEIYSHPLLKKSLAFRGGTALGKLFFSPQLRYSEDIDLVQIHAGPIKPIIDGIREALSFLGIPNVRQAKHNNTLRFSFDSEIPPVSNMKLKVEINTREHFTVLGYTDKSFSMENGWFSGSSSLTTYTIEELAGTKLRALYQRKKGRDLFDLFTILNSQQYDDKKIIDSYTEYMSFVTDHLPTKNEYLINLSKKCEDPEFIGDMEGLLSPGVSFDIHTAYELVRQTLLEKL